MTTDVTPGAPVSIAVVSWFAQRVGTTPLVGTLVTTTEKAVLLRRDDDGAEVWIPKSAVIVIDELAPIGEMVDADSLPDGSIPITRRDLEPWRHQRQAFWFAKDKRGAYLAMWMGVGKTRVAIDLVVNRAHSRVLVACPRAVINTWPDEFAEWAPEYAMVVPLLSGSIADRTQRARDALAFGRSAGKPVVCVINYEAAWQGAFGRWAMGAGWDCVVCDEVHRIKQASGVTSRWFGQLGKRVPWRIALSGTPMPHSPLDVYAQCRFLDPRVFGTSYTLFKSRYAVLGGFNGKIVVGFQHQAELQQKFYSIAFRVGKEVLSLPPITTVTRTCELSPKTRKVYAELEDAFYTAVDAGEVTVTNALTKILRLQQVTSGYLKLDDGSISALGTEKEDLLRDVMSDIAPEEPVAVVCRYHYDLDTVKRVMASCGRTCAELSGRMDQLQAWKDGEFSALVIQEQSGDAGVTVVRSCYMIHYSLDHSLGRYQQVIERIHRPGQERHTTYIHLIAEGTIDEKILRALHEKRDVIEAVLRR